MRFFALRLFSERGECVGEHSDELNLNECSLNTGLGSGFHTETEPGFSLNRTLFLENTNCFNV